MILKIRFTILYLICCSVPFTRNLVRLYFWVNLTARNSFGACPNCSGSWSTTWVFMTQQTQHYSKCHACSRHINNMKPLISLNRNSLLTSLWIMSKITLSFVDNSPFEKELPVYYSAPILKTWPSDTKWLYRPNLSSWTEGYLTHQTIKFLRNSSILLKVEVKEFHI